MKLAPIVLFAYNRKDHLLKTLDALEHNRFASESELCIFSDGAKNPGQSESVEEVRNFLREYVTNNPFSKTYLYESDVNKGLAQSIIEGVSRIISIVGKVIVIEDDVVTAPDFLEYMNTALNYFEDRKHIFSVSGLTIPIEVPLDYESDIIAAQRCSSCCWGTWQDRWTEIDWKIQTYKIFRFNFLKRISFNKWGNDRASMLDDQQNGRIDSWAIRFEYNMWRNGQLNILPRYTRANHIGNDGRGTHSSATNQKRDRVLNASIKELGRPLEMADVAVDDRIRNEFKKIFDVSPKTLLKRDISNLIYRKHNQRNSTKE